MQAHCFRFYFLFVTLIIFANDGMPDFLDPLLQFGTHLGLLLFYSMAVYILNTATRLLPCGSPLGLWVVVLVSCKVPVPEF